MLPGTERCPGSHDPHTGVGDPVIHIQRVFCRVALAVAGRARGVPPRPFIFEMSYF